MVDGKAYSLANHKGGCIRIEEIFGAEKEIYNWVYRGETKNNIEDTIIEINQAQKLYHTLLNNC